MGNYVIKDLSCIGNTSAREGERREMSNNNQSIKHEFITELFHFHWINIVLINKR